MQTLLSFRSTLVGLSLFAGFALLSGCTHSAPKDAPPERLSLKLDTVTIAVRDLKKVARRYRDDFGFTLKQGESRDGTDAIEARLGDGSRLRIVSTGDRTGNSELASFLAEREGLFSVTLALNQLGPFKENVSAGSGHLEDDRRAASAVGPRAKTALRLERGSSLSFLTFTDAYDPGDEQINHRNTSLGLAEVWIVVDSLSEIQDEVRRFKIGTVDETILQPMRAHALTLELDNGGKLIFIQRDHLEPEAVVHLGQANPQVTGVSLNIADIEGTGRMLKRARGMKHAIARYNQKSCLILAPKYTHGLFLEFIKSRE